MTELEFREKYKSEIHIFEAWGRFVSEKIIESLSSNGIDSAKLLKINVSPRVKDIDSLVAKAFYRNKQYSNPYDEITDKVGTRFVALLDGDVQKICLIIENIGEWAYSKDRDYELERADEPLSFNYQSMHYVVKANSNLNLDGTVIPSGTPCEIQIRTLLQHAYSELTHDRVYKSAFDPTSDVKRTVAKSMAFLETTDEYFQKISNLMLDLPIFKLYEVLKQKFSSVISDFKDGSKVNIHILHSYYSFVSSHDFSDSSIFEEFDSIVVANRDKSFLNNQPIIYFIYYMCIHHKNKLKEKWIYTDDELRPFFTQLGISMN